MSCAEIHAICLSVFVFFFSSRRRHTRFKCDWSSDVCSSDLGGLRDRGGDLPVRRLAGHRLHQIGRASCRGRGEISVGAVSFKKKKDKEEKNAQSGQKGGEGTEERQGR